MKWIVILLLIAVGVWAYFNVDFKSDKNNAQENTMNAIKNQKTIKKFFDADQQNKKETQETIRDNF